MTFAIGARIEPKRSPDNRAPIAAIQWALCFHRPAHLLGRTRVGSFLIQLRRRVGPLARVQVPAVAPPQHVLASLGFDPRWAACEEGRKARRSKILKSAGESVITEASKWDCGYGGDMAERDRDEAGRPRNARRVTPWPTLPPGSVGVPRIRTTSKSADRPNRCLRPGSAEPGSGVQRCTRCWRPRGRVVRTSSSCCGKGWPSSPLALFTCSAATSMARPRCSDAWV